MNDYLTKFDKIKNSVGPLVENLGKQMEAGDSEKLTVECKRFINELAAAEKNFSMLTPPPAYKKIHWLFAKLLKSYGPLVKQLKKYLRTGDGNYLLTLPDLLPVVEDRLNRFYDEVLRHNREGVI
ncbi:hypothetical protein [Candidatus Contubernalis alkaliaceticus]|uniref:hypothetical protein n=1 Tax=Candidatus Contubernalis alkaliaceticus TaxID=338645 RepID=UPI001F4BF1A2|nr:hypothetical protein [Candidatus Contubernalis alkalaceticus]UNC92409.1 hypothetical protein HUE98_10040 [Candidatus Contubernalis alkalaceticus]